VFFRRFRFFSKSSTVIIFPRNLLDHCVMLAAHHHQGGGGYRSGQVRGCFEKTFFLKESFTIKPLEKV